MTAKNDPILVLQEWLSMALALLETVVEEGLTEDHKSTIELFLADLRHASGTAK